MNINEYLKEIRILFFPLRENLAVKPTCMFFPYFMKVFSIWRRRKVDCFILQMCDIAYLCCKILWSYEFPSEH